MYNNKNCFDLNVWVISWKCIFCGFCLRKLVLLMLFFQNICTLNTRPDGNIESKSSNNTYLNIVKIFNKLSVTVIKLLLTAICDVRITSRRSWYCPFRGHSIITPSLGYIDSEKRVILSLLKTNQKLAPWLAPSFSCSLADG